MTICFWTSYIPEKKPSKHKEGWGGVGGGEDKEFPGRNSKWNFQGGWV